MTHDNALIDRRICEFQFLVSFFIQNRNRLLKNYLIQMMKHLCDQIMIHIIWFGNICHRMSLILADVIVDHKIDKVIIHMGIWEIGNWIIEIVNICIIHYIDNVSPIFLMKIVIISGIKSTIWWTLGLQTNYLKIPWQQSWLTACLKKSVQFINTKFTENSGTKLTNRFLNLFITRATDDGIFLWINLTILFFVILFQQQCLLQHKLILEKYELN